MYWINLEYAPKVSTLILIGIIVGSFISVVRPNNVFHDYLLNPKLLNVFITAIMSFFAHIDTVGSIIFSISLISSGTNPGNAITLLIVGYVTNISVILTIYKLLNKKAALIFTCVCSIYGIFAGFLTNKVMDKKFLNFEAISLGINEVNTAFESFPEIIKCISSIIICLYVSLFILKKVKPKSSRVGEKYS